MYFFLSLILFLFPFNSTIKVLPLERHISKIIAGENSVLILSQHSFGLYSPITDSTEYYPLNDNIKDAVNLKGTDTYILFGIRKIVILNKFLYEFYEISSGGKQFTKYRYNKDVYLQDVNGKSYLLNISGLFPEDTAFTDWQTIKTKENIRRFPQLSPYFISKGNSIYHYTSAALFRDKIFAGTDNFGFFIIDKYSGEKKHIINGLLGDITGIKSLKDKIIIHSDRDIAIVSDKHIDFLLDTLYFYPHFKDIINSVTIHNDTLFFAGEYSLYYIAHEGIYKFLYSSYKINDFTFYRGQLFYATNNGFMTIRGQKKKSILSGIRVFDIKKAGDILFLATNKGIYFMKGEKIGKMEQFPDIPYKEVFINSVALAAVSFDKTIRFLNLRRDSISQNSINDHLLKGNICTFDSGFIYISGHLIKQYPGNRIYPLPKYENKQPCGINIINGIIYLFQNNAVLFTPVNNIFPSLSH